MKNFKLLLATTAILSTGAILANATDSATEDYHILAPSFKVWGFGFNLWDMPHLYQFQSVGIWF